VTDLDTAEVGELLASWYRDGHRPLPWRDTRDPYAILVSEVMLQQTRVGKVLGYYGPFLARFPDVATLAAAGEAEVLKAWEGLGYYRRARQLLSAARALDGAGWPATVGGLMGLPGVGRSTAGAIASIAFGLRAPVLDGNVKRVWARLAGYDRVLTEKNLRPLWDLSLAAVSREDPGAVNQALMELGATVCTARRPKCGECPIARRCESLRLGIAETLPKRRPGKARPLVRVSVAMIWKDGLFLVTRRPSEGFLGGLWELPGGKWEEGEDAEQAMRREIYEELGIEVGILQAHAAVRHAYTHFEVLLHPFTCAPVKGVAVRSSRPLRWIGREEIGALAFPSGTLKVFSAVLTPGARAGLSRVAE
jgi:A/G-specific adenine glycosylase